ncbi:type I 3-dehydroquinate dehydratase [Sporomusa sp.]|uniref:type I 3-dehydroquinate dehydratase n=1 Tax=Sporomusa sp. TaxID=2078658 RepID=UPI002C7F37DE|nr:type I 3-dehydroquinate dehydratase [Sporomusa sp.]HWR44530.1 type I 3-dehydroquinate dehydratase [Sporomusa sp.]
MKHIIGHTDQPLVCAPLVARSANEILVELVSVLSKQPDIIEWRADFFADISQTNHVIEVAKTIKETAGHIPIIFCLRSVREGGHPIPLSPQQVAEVNIAVCRNTTIEYIDYEICNNPLHIRKLKDVAEMKGKKIIGSFHNFNCTPSREELIKKFLLVVKYRLDVAKVAVMPQCMEDVLTLLSATLEAKSKLDIPLIAVSMGQQGIASRLIGGMFGSALTFGVGSQASAPGQVPIEDLKAVRSIIEKSMGSKI